MLGIDERALKVVWTIFLFGLFLTVIYFIRDTILIFALAIFFAYMLWPVVGLIERLVPKRRNLALAMVYVALIGVLVLIGFELIPKLAEQATSLAKRLPSLLTSNRVANIPLPAFLSPVRAEIVSFATKQISTLGSRIGPFIQEAGKQILSGIGAILPMILIPILAFFFLKDGEQIRVNLIGAVETGHDQTIVERILDDIHLVLKNYIRALVLLAIASFVCWLVFLSVMGYSYDLLLAGLAGVLEFIPVIGPAAAGIVIVTVSGVTGPGALLWIIIFWGCYRVFADYVLSPYLMSAGVEVHPLLVLFGVLAGDSIAGVPGMFFSIPVIAIIRVVYLNLKKTYTRNRLSVADLRPSSHAQTLV